MRKISKETLLMWVAFAATTLLTLLPFFKVGLTTNDDLMYFNTAATSWDHWMRDAKIYAEGAGRFYFYITKVFYYVPYLVDSFVYTKAVQYLTLIGAYALFSYFVYRLFRSSQLGLLTLLLLIFDTALVPNIHMPTIAYPFYFTFSIIIFVTGMLLYLNYSERGGYWRVLLSAFIFLVAYLFYETYLLFALLFVAVVTVHHCRRDGWHALWSKSLWRELTPYAATALLYVGCYFGYRQYLLATLPDKVFYDGASFSPATFSLTGFFQVLLRCTEAALPGMSYFTNRGLIIDNSLLIGGHHSMPLKVLSHAPAIVWVNALLQTGLLWYLTGKKKLTDISWKKLGVAAIVSLVAAFFAHTLIGMASKYNQEWYQWMRGYVTSIYSLLCLMVFQALLITATIKLCRTTTGRRIVRGGWCLLILLFSVLMGYTSHHISREWQKSQNRITVIDLIARTGYFDTLPEDAVLCTYELRHTSWVAYNVCHPTQSLEEIINRRAGRSFLYLTESEQMAQVPADKPLYYVHALETKKGCELMVSISPVTSDHTMAPETLISTSADVFYYSPTKRYSVFYRNDSCWKAVPYNAPSATMRLTHLSLADSAIDPRTVLISNMELPVRQEE